MVLTASPAINEAMQKAIADGNAVEARTVGWEKVREVISMRKPLGQSLLLALNGDHRLRHWFSEGTPHNRAEEGYIDDQAKVSVSFPTPQTWRGHS